MIYQYQQVNNDINKSFININKYWAFININKWFLNINDSFINIKKLFNSKSILNINKWHDSLTPIIELLISINDLLILRNGNDLLISRKDLSTLWIIIKYWLS